MMSQSSEHIILEEIQKPELPGSDRYKVFFKYLLDKLSQGNRLHLYSLFSKIAYLDGIIKFDDAELRAFHTCRKYIEGVNNNVTPTVEAAFQFSLKRMIALVPDMETSQELWQKELVKWTGYDEGAVEIVETTSLIRAAILSVDQSGHELYILEENTGRRLRGQFNVKEINEQFNISIRHLGNRIPLPVMAHFLENRFTDDSTFIPSAIIIDPDFLVDVTAIAECFTTTSEIPLIHLMRQLMPKSTSPHLLIGNIANAILDRFMMGESLTYDQLMSEAFQLFALDFVLLSDEEVKKVSDQSKHLLHHLYHDVAVLLKENEGSMTYIEPSFVSPYYGIQGRLDALFLDE